MPPLPAARTQDPWHHNGGDNSTDISAGVEDPRWAKARSFFETILRCALMATGAARLAQASE